MKERLNYIDNLRGLLVLLVILGHCIQWIDVDFDHNIIFRYIYSFHMPLFMFISGYVSYSSNYKWASIKKRFIQLIVPFVAWSMLSMTLSGNYSLNWLTRPDTSLWFLWVLFWIGCVYIGISKLSRRFQVYEEIIITIACIIFLGLLFISKFSFGFHLFAWYLPFYCAGAITRKHQSNLFYKLGDFKWLFLLSFIILGYFWMRQESPTFISTNSTAVIYFYKFLVGFIGCYTFILFAQVYNHKMLYICELGGGYDLRNICYTSIRD